MSDNFMNIKNDLLKSSAKSYCDMYRLMDTILDVFDQDQTDELFMRLSHVIFLFYCVRTALCTLNKKGYITEEDLKNLNTHFDGIY